MKLVTVVLAFVALLFAGCVTQKHSVNYNTDRYSYEALERRFGKLTATDDKSGFSGVSGYGIWDRIYIKTTTMGDNLYRIDYINLHHREGTLLKDWKRGVETCFKVDLDVEKITYHKEPYNGWRIGFSTSSDLIASVFCWMEDKSPGDLDVDLDGKVTWRWGRVLYTEYSQEAKERRARRQKALKENKDG